jgi:hypothetical protein
MAIAPLAPVQSEREAAMYMDLSWGRGNQRGVAPASSSIVVFSAIDGVIRNSGDGERALSLAAPPKLSGGGTKADDCHVALDLLAAHGIPVVLVGHGSAADVQHVQRELGFRHPFICLGGSSLYIPRGYFLELDGLTSGDDEWEVFEFGAPDPARSIRLLTSLFSVKEQEVLTVGFACAWKDRALLSSVDVPIVVRTGSPEQDRLVRRLPGAYLTTAAGPAGMHEAIVGFPEV